MLKHTPGETRARALRAQQTEADEFVMELDDLLEDEGYDWASDTIQGIRRTVRDHQCVTAGQRTAIDNIKAGKEKGDAGRAFDSRRHSSRRYEGW